MNQTIPLCGWDCPAETRLNAASHPDFSDSSWSIIKKTLCSGVSAGVELIEVDNGRQVLSILPTRGMSLWKIQAGETRIGWDSPVKYPVNPAFVDLKARNGLGFLDGFNELFCRCGLSSNGPPGVDDGAVSPVESDLTLHGNIANRPAESVSVRLIREDDRAVIEIEGVVREAGLFAPQLELTATYRIELDSLNVEVVDQVRNCGGHPTEFQLLYHINVGSPILEEGSQWHAPLKSVAPKDTRAAEGVADYASYLPPTDGYAEQVYLCQLYADGENNSTALLTNKSATKAFRLDYNTETLPCFSVWKNTQHTQDGYCTGLEPATNFPNFKQFEREHGRVLTLNSDQIWKTEMRIGFLSEPSEVKRSLQEIESLQNGNEINVCSNPNPMLSLG